MPSPLCVPSKCCCCGCGCSTLLGFCSPPRTPSWTRCAQSFMRCGQIPCVWYLYDILASKRSRQSSCRCSLDVERPCGGILSPCCPMNLKDSEGSIRTLLRRSIWSKSLQLLGYMCSLQSDLQGNPLNDLCSFAGKILHVPTNLACHW